METKKMESFFFLGEKKWHLFFRSLFDLYSFYCHAQVQRDIFLAFPFESVLSRLTFSPMAEQYCLQIKAFSLEDMRV